MAQVSIDVNGKPYVIGCEDGQENHLTELAQLFDRHVRQVSAEVGQLGETRLFLMGALLLADELFDARLRLGQAQGEVARLQAERSRIQEQALGALTAAAEKVEALVAAN